jgi:hypothetical protein
VTRDPAEELLLLRHRLERLEGLLTARDATTCHPVDWARLDHQQARDAWAQLTSFVDMVFDRYGLYEAIPGCWYQHPAMVEELSALNIAWLGSYRDPQAPPDAGVDWHDALERVLIRVREWDRNGCTGGTHRADVAMDCADCAEQIEVFIQRDLAGRQTEDRSAVNAAEVATPSLTVVPDEQ